MIISWSWIPTNIRTQRKHKQRCVDLTCADGGNIGVCQLRRCSTRAHINKIHGMQRNPSKVFTDVPVSAEDT